MTAVMPTPLRPVGQLTLADLDREARALLKRLNQLAFDWSKSARPEQLWPASDPFAWLILAGRGWGKTRTGAETVRQWATGAPGHYAVIAKNDREVRNVCFDAPRAGLNAVIPPELIASYNKSTGDTKITLTNGSIIRAFSAEQPDNLRGYAFDGAWCDEFAAWPKKTAQDVWDNLLFCLREARKPRVIISTTPKNVKHVKDMLAKATSRRNYVVTRGHTDDNRANLSAEMLEELEVNYAGTRVGRQELGGELLEDVENALWTLDLIGAAQWRTEAYGELPAFVETVCSYDPSGSENGDAAGIVVVARASEQPRVDIDGQPMAPLGAAAREAPFIVLGDYTTKGTPENRNERCCLAAFAHQAGVILYEGAYGGDNIATGLRSAWRELQRRRVIPETVPMPKLMVAPTQGTKADRAQPVVGLYEQTALGAARIFHAKPMPQLEDEMTTWEPTDKWSPNRIDALVHAVRYLLRVAGYVGKVSSSAGIQTPGGGRGRGRR